MMASVRVLFGGAGHVMRSREDAQEGLYRIDPLGSAVRQLGLFICANGRRSQRLVAICLASIVLGGQFMAAWFQERGRSVPRSSSPNSKSRHPDDVKQLTGYTWGYPDGLRCDEERCVWIAQWGSGRIARFVPTVVRGRRREVEGFLAGRYDG
jgi:sugar lactone lactonase YvrE